MDLSFYSLHYTGQVANEMDVLAFQRSVFRCVRKIVRSDC